MNPSEFRNNTPVEGQFDLSVNAVVLDAHRNCINGRMSFMFEAFYPNGERMEVETLETFLNTVGSLKLFGRFLLENGLIQLVNLTGATPNNDITLMNTATPQPRMAMPPPMAVPPPAAAMVTSYIDRQLDAESTEDDEVCIDIKKQKSEDEYC